MPLTAGTLLGPYEIISPLGAGGMGEVYRAQDTQLKREVALIDRAGKRLSALGPVMKSTVASAPSLSPDGNRVVMQRRDPKTRGWTSGWPISRERRSIA